MRTLNPLFVRRDGGTLDADVVLEDGVRRVDGHLVVGGVAMRQAQVKVQAVQLVVGPRNKTWRDWRAPVLTEIRHG